MSPQEQKDMRNSLRHTNTKSLVVVATLLVLGLAALTHADTGSIGSAHLAGSEKPSPEGQASILGTWKVDRYVLRDGRDPRVDGSILFTEDGGWAVLFFVIDEDGEPRRGSGEGGTYTVEGDRLTFFHLYTMQGGEAVEGYDASDLSLTLREPEAAVSEACTIELAADQMTIHFPSGSRIEFSRSSG